MEFSRMEWYLLPPSRRRELSSMIHLAQNGPVLGIGPLAELNLETFTSVRMVFTSFESFKIQVTHVFMQMTRTIYRIAMLLKKMYG